MKIISKYLTVLATVFCLTLLSQAVQAADVDIYIAYSNKDKSDKKALESALSDYNVMSYKVDLLAMADYSGQQKAAAKLSQAKVVVLLKDKPVKYLRGAELGTTVEVSGSSAEDIAKIKAAL